MLQGVAKNYSRSRSKSHTAGAYLRFLCSMSSGWNANNSKLGEHRPPPPPPPPPPPKEEEWNRERRVVFFCGGRKTRELENISLEARREPTTNSINMRRHISGSVRFFQN